MGEAQAPGVNLGEFRRDVLSGRGWTYRMYLVGIDTVRVDRIFPDPAKGVAGAANLRALDQGRARWDFPSTWQANGSSELARTAITNAWWRHRGGPPEASIRFGDLVLVMSTEPGAGTVRVVEPQRGTEPQWVANLSALHKEDPAKVQLSWNALAYGDVFGVDLRSSEGRAARLRLATAAQALWRSSIRHDFAIPVQRTAPDLERTT